MENSATGLVRLNKIEEIAQVRQSLKNYIDCGLDARIHLGESD